MTALEFLELSANRLGGPIPSELGNLTELKHLDLRHNRLEGAIPPALGKLENLRFLRLWYNELDGLIPAELGQLTELETLDLRNNGLDGAIPAELAKLDKLQHLDLRYNVNLGPMPTVLAHLQPGTGRVRDAQAGSVESQLKQPAIGEVSDILAVHKDPGSGLLSLELDYDTRGKGLELELGVVDLATQTVHAFADKIEVSGSGEMLFTFSHWDQPIEDGVYTVWVNLVDPGVSCMPACAGKHYARDEVPYTQGVQDEEDGTVVDGEVSSTEVAIGVGDLVVHMPAGGLVYEGMQGGPFVLVSSGIEVENVGNSQIEWSLSRWEGAQFYSYTPEEKWGGQLAPGQLSKFPLFPSGSARDLAPGIYTSTHQVGVVDSEDSAQLPATLHVLPASRPYTDPDLVDEQSAIDVLVVYTPGAERQAGGADAIQAEIREAIKGTNRIFANSAVTARIRLAGSQGFWVDYDEHEVPLEALGSEYQAVRMGDVPGMAVLRDTHRPDLTMLITKYFEGDTIGLGGRFRGKVPTVFSTVMRSDTRQIMANSVAHELGHNLGCQHQDDDDDPIFSFTQGYVFEGPDGRAYRTIMALPNNNRILYFSNPRLTWMGIPIGDPETADCAGTIARTAPLVATYNGKDLSSELASFLERLRTTLQPLEPVVGAIDEVGDDVYAYVMNIKSVPAWVRNTVRWWVNEKISDDELLQALSYLVSEGIVDLDVSGPIVLYVDDGLPDRLRQGAFGSWVDGKTEDVEFLNALQFLVEQGIIKVRADKTAVAESAWYCGTALEGLKHFIGGCPSCDMVQLEGAVTQEGVLGFYRQRDDEAMWDSYGSYAIQWNAQSEGGHWEVNGGGSIYPLLLCIPETESSLWSPASCTNWQERVGNEFVPAQVSAACVTHPPKLRLSVNDVDLDAATQTLQVRVDEADTYGPTLEAEYGIVQMHTRELYGFGESLVQGANFSIGPVWDREPEVGFYALVVHLVDPGVDCSLEASTSCAEAYVKREFYFQVASSKQFGNGGKVDVCTEKEGRRLHYPSHGIEQKFLELDDFDCRITNESDQELKLRIDYDSQYLHVDETSITVSPKEQVDVRIGWSSLVSGAPPRTGAMPVLFTEMNTGQTVTRTLMVDVDEAEEAVLVHRPSPFVVRLGEDTREPVCKKYSIELRGNRSPGQLRLVQDVMVASYLTIDPQALVTDSVTLRPGPDNAVEFDVCVDLRKQVPQLTWMDVELDGEKVASISVQIISVGRDPPLLALDRLAAPDNVQAVSYVHSIALTWDAVPKAEGYGVYRGLGSDYRLFATIAADNTRFVDFEPFGESANYAISAWNDQGESALSAPVSAKPKPLEEGNIPSTTPSNAPLRALLLRFAYPTTQHEHTVFDDDHWAEETKEASDYLAQLSEGQFLISIEVEKDVVLVPGPPSKLRDGDHLQHSFVRTAMESAQQTLDVDWHAIDFLILAFPGMKDLLLGYAEDNTHGVLVKDREISEIAYLTGSYSARTMVHEILHLLDLPDLYWYEDHGRQFQVGRWGVMGSGYAGLSAWSRVELGWVKAREITTSQKNVSLAAGEVVKIPVPNSAEYFLLEIPQEGESFRFLPEVGVLVWHVRPGYTETGKDGKEYDKWLDLVEASEHQDLESPNGEIGDPTDPFYRDNPTPGYTNRVAPQLVDGTSAGFVLSNFSEAATTMTFDIVFGDSEDAIGPVPKTEKGATNSLLHCLSEEDQVWTAEANDENTAVKYFVDGQSLIEVTVEPQTPKSQSSWTDKNWVAHDKLPTCLSKLPKDSIHWTEEKIPLWVLQELSHNEVAVFQTTAKDCGPDGIGYAMVTSGENAALTLDSGNTAAFLDDAAPNAILIGHVHDKATIFPSRSDYEFLERQNKKNGQKDSLIYPKQGDYAYRFGLPGSQYYDPATWALACEEWKGFESEASSSDTGAEKSQVIPAWFRNNADWWLNKQIDDKTFIQGLLFLAEQGVVDLGLEPGDETLSSAIDSIELPEWLETTVGAWTEGVTSDEEFVSAMRHYIDIGVIGVDCDRACEGKHHARNQTAWESAHSIEVENCQILEVSGLEGAGEIANGRYERVDAGDIWYRGPSGTEIKWYEDGVWRFGNSDADRTYGTPFVASCAPLGGRPGGGPTSCEAWNEWSPAENAWDLVAMEFHCDKVGVRRPSEVQCGILEVSGFANENLNGLLYRSRINGNTWRAADESIQIFWLSTFQSWTYSADVGEGRYPARCDSKDGYPGNGPFVCNIWEESDPVSGEVSLVVPQFSCDDGTRTWSGGLSSYWPFDSSLEDEESPRLADDDFRRKGAVFVDGVRAQALKFRDQSAERTQYLPTFHHRSVGVPTSVSVWIRPEILGGTIVDTAWEGRGWTLGLTVDNRLQVALSDGSGRVGIWQSTVAVPLEEWSHLGVSIDEYGKEVRFFLNGKSIGATHDGVTSLVFGSADSERYIAVGGRVDSLGDYAGAIDELRLFRGNLGEDEFLRESKRTDSVVGTLEKETSDLSGYKLPPHLWWCDYDDCVLDIHTVRVCRGIEDCTARNRFHLSWSIDGRSFAGFSLLEQTRLGAAVRIESPRTRVSLDYGYHVQPGVTHLAYESYEFTTELGEVSVVSLPEFVNEVPKENDGLWQLYDQTARQIASMTGIPPEPYRLHLLPNELMGNWGKFGGEYHGDGIITMRSSLNSKISLFAHEYGHLAFDRTISDTAMHDGGFFRCLNEGLSQTIARNFGGHWIRDYSNGCTATDGPHSRGECIFWQVEAQGYSTASLLRDLYHPKTALHFDTCAVVGNSKPADREVTGNGYLVYLSEAVGKDLTSVVEAAGLPNAGSYAKAKNFYTQWLLDNGHSEDHIWNFDGQLHLCEAPSGSSEDCRDDATTDTTEDVLGEDVFGEPEDTTETDVKTDKDTTKELAHCLATELVRPKLDSSNTRAEFTGKRPASIGEGRAADTEVSVFVVRQELGGARQAADLSFQASQRLDPLDAQGNPIVGGAESKSWQRSGSVPNDR